MKFHLRNVLLLQQPSLTSSFMNLGLVQVGGTAHLQLSPSVSPSDSWSIIIFNIAVVNFHLQQASSNPLNSSSNNHQKVSEVKGHSVVLMEEDKEKIYLSLD